MKRLLGALLLVSAAARVQAESTLVVYLPATPVESAGRLGEAVTDLGTYLSAQVPGLSLSVRPFRKGEDALAYVSSAGNEVALVLSDSSFLMDLPAAFAPTPCSRALRGGKDTVRKIVVVPAADEAVKSLADLRGHSLSLVGASGETSQRYLGRVVFDGQISPETWFGKLVPEVDEFTATANVLFGRSDAALVAPASSETLVAA